MCNAEIRHGANMKKALSLCDITTKVLVKCRIPRINSTFVVKGNYLEQYFLQWVKHMILSEVISEQTTQLYEVLSLFIGRDDSN